MGFRKCILILILISTIVLVGYTTISLNNMTNKTSTATEMNNEQILDYNKYINKTWVNSNGSGSAGNLSIYKIDGNNIDGNYSIWLTATPSRYGKTINFTGYIENDIALCHFNDSHGNSGAIEIQFLNNEELEVTIKLEEKSFNEEYIPLEGTYKFVPENIYNVEEYHIIEDKSFAIDLSLWGNVNLTCAEILESIHEPPLVILLTNEKGDVLFDFLPDTPYGAKLQETEFVDVNEDGLKDVIFLIYEADKEGIMTYFSTLVYLQQEDGCFVTDDKIMDKINKSENFVDVKKIDDIIEYIKKNIKE